MIKKTQGESITEKVVLKDTNEPVVITEPVIPESMNKEVIPTSNFHCVIGGVRYEFRKNQKQKVPADVERVLREADKIK